jgi:V/A-type H+-transporting ATPase subunit E
MSDQLQDLLTKVYEEGVAKANAEAEKILAKAQSEAEATLTKAKQEAELTIKEAQTKAKELAKNAESDLKMASNHTLSALKQKITDLVLNAAVNKAVTKSFTDDAFVKNLIKESLSAWKQNSQSASITLAESMQKQMDEAFLGSLKQIFDGKLKVEFSPLLKTGFSISPADGGYKLSFTDEDFASLFKSYLRPRTAQILFD